MGETRVVTKISSCQVNTTSRPGIEQLGISFGSIVLLFSNKSSRGPHSVAGGNPRPPALNDSPYKFSNKDLQIYFTRYVAFG